MGYVNGIKDEFRVRVSSCRCIYCGETATTDEHFPPRSYTHIGYILRSCRECNLFAGANHPTDFEARCKYIQQKIKDKNVRALQTPDWSAEELLELGYSMRASVKKWQKKKRIIQERLAWSVAAYLSSIDHQNVFVPIDAGGNFTTMSEKELMIKLGVRKKDSGYERHRSHHGQAL